MSVIYKKISMLEIVLINCKEIESQIKNILMNYDYCYKISNDINLETNKFKIYIIKINSLYDKNINIIKKIRYQLNDWQSMIIIIVEKEIIKIKLLNEEIMPLSIIKPDNNYNSNLNNSFQRALISFNNHPNTLKYTYKGINYNIDFRNVVYIEKEKDNKRCIIKTINNNYIIPGNLCNIINKLDKRFIKCSRSYIINMDQIAFFNTKGNEITFKNNQVIKEISRSIKKEILSYLRSI